MSTPHICANVGDIAETILLPGDPMRAKYIAEKYLEAPKMFNNVRGMYGYTGTYKGKQISVMGTGMGMPSISIYATELMKVYGVKNLIRIGTCGAYNTDISLMDIVLAMGCCTDSSFVRNLFPGDYAPIADFDLLSTAYEKACAHNKKTHVGLIKTSDVFYTDEDAAQTKKWVDHGVMAVDMEGAGLYIAAAKHKCRALTLCTVSDCIYDGGCLSSEDRELSLNDMIKIALETAIEF